MAAGDSAGREAERQLARAAAFDQEAERARTAARNFAVASTTERATARVLAPLAAVGWHLLPDRGWPGSRTAQVDLVLVGPGGVFIVDTKAWHEVSIERGRVLRGDADVTDDVMALADLAYSAEADFAEIGLAPGEVRPVAVLAGRSGINERVGPVHIVGERDVLRHISSHGQRLTPTQVDAVLSRAIAYFPQVGAARPVAAVVPEPVLPAARTPSLDALISRQEVEEALLAGILAKPIEEWMSFLHPAQAKLVRRTFNGPARIRGAAGTGKTVVGLHRAAYLARSRPGRVLVTTYVRTLPDVLRELLSRLAPDVLDRVDFAGAHAVARRLLIGRGIDVHNDKREIDLAWDKAWSSAGRNSMLDSDRLGERYVRDEIDHVLKGRGITAFEDYADLARPGRRYPLNLDQRTAVWGVYEAYGHELTTRGAHDWADLVLMAERELAREPSEDYAAVIVDEAQDLSCATIRMLHALVGDRTDGLTLIGDGQQSIYPGGYTLPEAGVSLAGRGVVLSVNYRNTAQILRFASRMVEGDEFSDIEGTTSLGDPTESVPRSGPEPVRVFCRTVEEHDVLLVERVRSAIKEVGTTLGDVGVLCVSRDGVRRAVGTLLDAGLPVVELDEYDGRPVEAVKVGTVKRAKGLEFKQVLLAHVVQEWLKPAPTGDGAQAREAWALRRRELYVAMTRARDGLWVGIQQ